MSATKEPEFTYTPGEATPFPREDKLYAMGTFNRKNNFIMTYGPTTDETILLSTIPNTPTAAIVMLRDSSTAMLWTWTRDSWVYIGPRDRMREFTKRNAFVNFSPIPEGFYLKSLKHEHTALEYRWQGEKRVPICWRATLGSVNDDTICTDVGVTPQQAVDRTILLLKK